MRGRAGVEPLGYHGYRSQIAPSAVLGTLAAFEVRYDCPVVYEPTPEAAGRRVETWGWYFARETVQSLNTMIRGAQGEAIQ